MAVRCRPSLSLSKTMPLVGRPNIPHGCHSVAKSNSKKKFCRVVSLIVGLTIFSVVRRVGDGNVDGIDGWVWDGLQ